MPPLENQEYTPEPSHKKSFKTFDRSDWLALFAMLISMAALAVSAYEASILREQQQLMQTQQKASVWPYLLVNSSFEIDAKEGITTWKCTITNKGVGPALIKKVKLLFGGEELDQYNEINNYLKSTFPESSLMVLSYSTIEGDVLSSGQSVELFRVITDHSVTTNDILSKVESYVEICFCSIYDDCWLANDKEVVSVEGCSSD